MLGDGGPEIFVACRKTVCKKYESRNEEDRHQGRNDDNEHCDLDDSFHCRTGFISLATGS